MKNAAKIGQALFVKNGIAYPVSRRAVIRYERDNKSNDSSKIEEKEQLKREILDQLIKLYEAEVQ